ncbi:MAG: NADH:flavin oxidoreductase/NADH oxidase [Rhodobacteraceae bacterium]|nr:NADH:flavin oxidoreductase/NADH oxidase [Paracoccaceae bacterium]
MPSHLFSPLDIGGMRVGNRIAVSPMCQYSAVDGVPGDWHVVHLGTLAQSGPGLIVVEATGVAPEGRITPRCTGLWSDAQEAAFARLVALCRGLGPARIGIQLGHAGRKGSTAPPWEGRGTVGPRDGGWRNVAPSALPFQADETAPLALDARGLARVRDDFVRATGRAVRAGFDLVEIHAAHGYLLHQFLSPLSNRRADAYGGSLANRMRFPLEVIAAVRAALPADRPLLVRVSATDWVEGGWSLEDTVAFATEARGLGVAMIDVSSGGLDAGQRIAPGPGYQTGFAEAVRRRAEVPTMAVGLISEPVQAETILRSGQADMVALARAMLWNPRWVWHAASALGEEAAMPVQYIRAAPRGRGARPLVPREPAGPAAPAGRGDGRAGDAAADGAPAGPARAPARAAPAP